MFDEFYSRKAFHSRGERAKKHSIKMTKKGTRIMTTQNEKDKRLKAISET